MRIIGLFSEEANAEARKMVEAPLNYLDPMGKFTRGILREGGLALYMLTRRAS